MGEEAEYRDRGRRKFRGGLTDALLKFAGARFALSKIDPNTKKSRMQTLLDIRKQTGVTPSELAAIPPLPPEVEHIWDWFCELGEARQDGFEKNPIGWSDMHGFFSLLRISPEPWEVRAVRALDRAMHNARAGTHTATARSAAEAIGMVGGKRDDD